MENEKSDMKKIVGRVASGSDLRTMNLVINELEEIGKYDELVEELEEKVSEELKSMKQKLDENYSTVGKEDKVG